LWMLMIMCGLFNLVFRLGWRRHGDLRKERRKEVWNVLGN
jgi:hypothetical protein